MSEGKVVAEVSIIPVGVGTGLSDYVASALRVLDDARDIKYSVTSMGTIVGGDLDRILEVVRRMHEVPFEQGARRVITTLRVDDRRDKGESMERKVRVVLKKLGRKDVWGT